MSPYREALAWMEEHPTTGSAAGLAKLTLSLWNGNCAFSYRECVSSLDGDLAALALRMVSRFAEKGEDQDLRAIGKVVCEMFPRLWEIGDAGDDAKNAKRQEFREADEREVREEARTELAVLRDKLRNETNSEDAERLREKIADLEYELRG